MPLVKSEKAELFYEIIGDGPVVTFAHGAGGNTLIWWQQVPIFANKYTVVTFDHRGFGRSHCESAHNHARYFPDDLKRILDAAGVERTALVCQSMGGWTGLHFALKYPHKVSCLVLSGTPAGIHTPKVLEAFETIVRRRVAEMTQPQAWNEPHWALASDAFERYPTRAYLYTQLSSLNPPLEDMGLGDMGIEFENLEGFKTPTLLIAGAKDRIFSPQLLEEVAQIIPGARFEKIDASGHSPYFETPEEYNSLVMEFLDAHARVG